MDPVESRNLESETTVCVKVPQILSLSVLLSFEGDFNKEQCTKNQLLSRVKENAHYEWMKNYGKVLQQISSLDISHKSLLNIASESSLHRDILVPFRSRYSQLEFSTDYQLSSTCDTLQLNSQKVIRTTIPFPDDVTRIDLIEFTGKSEERVNWADVSNKMNSIGRRLTKHSNCQMCLASANLGDNVANGHILTEDRSACSSLPSCGLTKEAPLSIGDAASGNGKDVVECFTYYANTILPQKHRNPEESELSNGIIKEINQLYLKYKNFNILEGHLSQHFEKIRSNIIRNLNKRKRCLMSQKVKFSCLEDCILLVSYHKEILRDYFVFEFEMVANAMPWRSSKVIKQRLKTLLTARYIRFTIAEDRLLLKAVEILGPKWNEISELMRGRDKSRRACRSHYELLQKILKKQTLEEWHQASKRKSLPVKFTGSALKIFCTFSYILFNWELVEPLKLSDLSDEGPPKESDLKRYLRSFDLPLVSRAKKTFLDRMQIYFDFTASQLKSYSYDKMKFDRKIPQSWAAAIYLRDIEMKPIWEIETPSRFELAIYYYYCYKYGNRAEKKKTASRILMPSQRDLLGYPEISNIVDKEASVENSRTSPDSNKVLFNLAHGQPTTRQREQFGDGSESEDEASDTESASEWETLSDEEDSSSDGESVSDTATVSDWDTFSETEPCSDSDEQICEVIDSDSGSTPTLDEASSDETPGVAVATAQIEDIDFEVGSQIIYFRDVQLAEDTPNGDTDSHLHMEVPDIGEDEAGGPESEGVNISPLATVMLDHDYCKYYTYVSRLDGSPGVQLLPTKCFQNVRQQVIQQHSPVQTSTEGKRYRKRVHRAAQTTSASKTP